MPFDGTELPLVTQALMAGRQRIERGWCQGHGRSITGVCAAAALYGSPEEALRLLGRVVGDVNIARWNDAPERTKEDVLAAYDQAIALSLK